MRTLSLSCDCVICVGSYIIDARARSELPKPRSTHTRLCIENHPSPQRAHYQSN